MRCVFERSDCGCECECGRCVRAEGPCEKVVAKCRKYGPEPKRPTGAGDWVENWLTSWGMTKDKYVELKEKLGLPPTCHCTGRQEWLNRAGAYLGIAADRYGPNRKKNNGS